MGRKHMNICKATNLSALRPAARSMVAVLSAMAWRRQYTIIDPSLKSGWACRG